MSKRVLKKAVVPAIYGVAICILGTSMYLIERAVNDNRFKDSENIEYVDNEIVTDKEYIPVINEDNTILKPFLNDNITVKVK